MDNYRVSEEFKRLAADERSSGYSSLDQFIHHLENFPDLANEELEFCIAIGMLDKYSTYIGLQLLMRINGESLVASYARIYLAAFGNPQHLNQTEGQKGSARLSSLARGISRWLRREEEQVWTKLSPVNDQVPLSDAFHRLDSQEDVTRVHTLAEYIGYLEDFPGLTRDELLYCIAQKIFYIVSPVVGLRLLRGLSGPSSIARLAYAFCVSNNPKPL